MLQTISLQDTDDIRSKQQTSSQLFTFRKPMVGSLTHTIHCQTQSKVFFKAHKFHAQKWTGRHATITIHNAFILWRFL